MPNSIIELDSGVSARQRERKFLLGPEAAQAFWLVAQQHLRDQPQDATRPYSFLRTSYFDTPGLSFFRSGRGPVARRLRVREYAVTAEVGGVPELSPSCFLELKQSSRGERVKLRVPLEAGDLGVQLAKLADGPLTPVLTTWYQRSALGDDGDGLRVTLDRAVRFCAPIAVGSPCQSDQPPGIFANGPGHVLEVKLWGAPPPWLARELGALTESIRFSKFNAGMKAAEECGLLGGSGWNQGLSATARP